MTPRQEAAHQVWRAAIHAQLPKTAARVFALRTTDRTGGPSSHELERQLGSILAMVNDASRPLTFGTAFTDEALYEDFIQQLEEAEEGISEPLLRAGDEEAEEGISEPLLRAGDEEAEVYLQTHFPAAEFLPVGAGGVDMSAIESFRLTLESGRELLIRIRRDGQAQRDFVECEVVQT